MRLRHDAVTDNAREGCKGSAARTLSDSGQGRLRRIAAAGALGLAVLFGSASARAQDGGAPPAPDSAAAPDAAAAEAAAPSDAAPAEASAPASAPAAAPQQAPGIQSLPGAMNVPLESDTHPANATDPAVLTTNTLRILQLGDILRSPPAAPRDGEAPSPERSAYDSAVRAFGSEAAAIAAVDEAAARAINNLGGAARTRDAMGSDAQALQARLQSLDESIGNIDAPEPLIRAGNSVGCLLRMMRGGEACADTEAAPQERDRPSGTEELPIIEMLPFDFGSQFFLSGFSNGQFTMTDPETTPALSSLFGGESVAQGALNAWGNALETLMNSPNDPGAQASAAHALHEALSRIPSDKEIWTRPGFNEAMTALHQGDLRGGLAALRSEPAFNAVWSQLGTLDQLTISQRPVARLRTGINLRFPEGTNPSEFLAFRRGSEERRYAWDLLYYNVGANYANLLMSGRLQSYNVDFNTFALTPAGPARTLEGEGHAIDGMLGLTFGGTIFRQPVETTLSGRLGYLSWDIESTDNNGRPISASDGTMYGMLNLDFSMVGYEGRTSDFRLSRFGLGMFNLNPYAYFTLTGRSYIGNMMRLEHSITPQYLMFWGMRQEGVSEDLFFQHRVGADVRPLDFSFQHGHGLTWYVGPGLHYMCNTEQNIHSFEPYVHASLRWAEGVSADARVGYFMDAFGDESYHAPRTVTGTINLVLTPTLWFSGSSSSGSVSVDAGAGAGERK